MPRIIREFDRRSYRYDWSSQRFTTDFSRKISHTPRDYRGVVTEPSTSLNLRNPLPLARRVGFSSFNNRFAQQACYIVGRGVTDFDYAQLASVTEPVFFINDAICLEQ